MRIAGEARPCCHFAPCQRDVTGFQPLALMSFVDPVID
jgi:hypothetical protein